MISSVRIRECTSSVLPTSYTWFTLEAMEDSWRNLQKLIKEREAELLREAKRQEKNEDLRKTFAQHANTFHGWLTDTRWANGSLGMYSQELRLFAGSGDVTWVEPFVPLFFSHTAYY